jgi:hypothetical protein
MMNWHALPEGWHEMNYEDFLNERQKLIAQVTRDGFERLTGDAGLKVSQPESAVA